jgi:hypothetical protein
LITFNLLSLKNTQTLSKRVSKADYEAEQLFRQLKQIVRTKTFYPKSKGGIKTQVFIPLITDLNIHILKSSDSSVRWLADTRLIESTVIEKSESSLEKHISKYSKIK